MVDEECFPPAPLRGLYRLVLGLWLLAGALLYWRAAQGLPTTTEFVVIGIGWMAVFVYFPIGLTPSSYRLIAPRQMPDNPDDSPLLIIGHRWRWQRDEYQRLTGRVRDARADIPLRRLRAWLSSSFTLTDWDRAVLCERNFHLDTVISPANPEAFMRAWERMTGQERW